jgi:hypothetical protein
MELGFFQLGRPFEVYRATYRRDDGAPVPNPDMTIDESMNIRKLLPAQDHADVFYRTPANNPKSIAVGKKAQVEAVNYDDRPSSIFQKDQVHSTGDYSISGIALESFFFLGFGLLRGGTPLMLATRYWTIKHCEARLPSLDLSQERIGRQVEITPQRDCRKGNCDLSEPGAAAPAGSAPGWGNTASPAVIYRQVIADAVTNQKLKGPGLFKLACK